MNPDFIKTLKLGDSVIFYGRGLGECDGICNVEKITLGGRIKVNGVLFNPNGFEVGTGYSRRHIGQPTDEEVMRIKKEFLVRKLKGLKYSDLSYEKLKAIYAIFEEKQ